MQKVTADFNNLCGKMKPMNAVNNGPAGAAVRGTGNFNDYKALKIPYARLHDSSFYSGYGGEFSVDVHRIFPNFNADANNPASYIFEPTDEYLSNIEAAGTKVYYRLGASIEHGYKKGTYPPADFLKWARICEHIILHYTQGWANGFQMDIEYWEIWNEPDCTNRDGSHPCWQGTIAEFNDFYCIVATYLKEKFPKLKIGGPAWAWVWDPQLGSFFETVKKRNAPLDFFSFHFYGRHIRNFNETVAEILRRTKEYGFENLPLHLNEWNYVRGWVGDEYSYSLDMQKRAKGAAYVASVMSEAQKSPLDMLMYYDARPCTWNGLFDDMHRRLKPFYTFQAFSQLVDLGESVETKTEGDVYACAAKNKQEGALLLSRFDDNDETPSTEISVEFFNVEFGDCIKVEYYLLDDNHNMELMREEFFTANRFNLRVKMENASVYLIKLCKVD